MANTDYYDQNADRLYTEYSALQSDDIHCVWTEKCLSDRNPGIACDIGAGSGRDANWLAVQGWDVIAVEPSKLRPLGESDSLPNVNWINDSLPDLKELRKLGHQFDLILLSAVWQHVPETQRERVFRILCELLKPSGLLIFSLRRSNDLDEQRDRNFHPVSSSQLNRLADRKALLRRHQSASLQDLKRDYVSWDWLVFEMPDDGTGNLPLLRNIIVNDNKSASYKLGLLRTLVKLAENAPGIVTKRTDDYVEIPLGAVGLFWLKLYWPLVLSEELLQNPSGKYGFAKDAFFALKNTSPLDLGFGKRFQAGRAHVIHQAIADACRNIRNMPVKHTTYPGSDRQVFECGWEGIRKPSGTITLSKEYLSKFGTFRIPAQLWQTLGQYACWLDPTIVGEWRQLIAPWQTGIAKNQLPDDRVFHWREIERDTTLALARAKQLRSDGFQLSCIWSSKPLSHSSKIEMDHCFPFARWPNNDLWNLLPTNPSINNSKSDRLPTAAKLESAKERLTAWWEHAWLDSSRKEEFHMEASYSLPGLSADQPKPDQIHQAVKLQRLRLKQDQQIPEWPPLDLSLPLNQSLREE